jgi:hypothetical protein
MKIMNLICIGISVLLMSGCASKPNETTESFPPAAITSPASDLLVISAVYGSGVKFADVTYRVNALLHQPSVKFFARPEWLNADPTPGWNKALVIVYEFKGRRHLFTTGEGGEVSLNQLKEQEKIRPQK